MATYREQLEVLEGIKLAEGQTRRITCPFCGGRGTFSISRKNGSRVWNCYKASCGIRGGKDTEMSADGIKRRLAGQDLDMRTTDPLPIHVSRPQSQEKVMEYLRSVGSMEAFDQGLVEIKFSPADNRVMFYMNNRTGAVGRALDRRKPKWKAFGDTSGLFTVGTGRTAILVEDAASACAMGMFTTCSGCALLGTSISVVQKHQLLAFDRVIIALDKDASRKALRLQRQLEGRVDTRVMYLEEDLKYLNIDQRRRLINESAWTDPD